MKNFPKVHITIEVFFYFGSVIGSYEFDFTDTAYALLKLESTKRVETYFRRRLA